ncbi:type II CAAX endopeptidase family protein [Ureibacillus endophyticus]|uniref:CPBP family intramembrane metalloprotease n=1 Tax=Ureibacillus endophyticus TaxID=1978490 RepID=A0A494YWK7_9BACL|nr:type II CAAX endopeptidase family protein [Lysinibacillus endophyticus]RKQ14599.1 CPBP family intramembrane metalloprotease [Lysinibacillus endophyticus]
MFTNLSDLQKSGFFIALVLMIASLFGVLKITPEVYMFAPMIALVIMFFVITRDGYRKKEWSTLGLHRTGKGLWLFCILVPFVCLGCAYFITWSTPYASPFVPEEAGSIWTVVMKVIILFIFHTVTSSLGEELGWRGYLLPKLITFGWKKAVLLTGFIHAIFHIPLMLAGLYHSEGNPMIIYPLMIVQTIIGGVLFGYVRLKTNSVWPAAILHSAHNVTWALCREFTQVQSDLAYYIGGENGLIMIVLYGTIACWILQKANINQLPKKQLNM